ncbi:hypothetical protein QG37_00910 [Candidozyma auris]|nr:hypothetical protein QG37_00910 [[Candida] auris]
MGSDKSGQRISIDQLTVVHSREPPARRSEEEACNCASIRRWLKKKVSKVVSVRILLFSGNLLLKAWVHSG